MALSGLDIYKLLPKTNCKECGFPTCLAFAMQLAKKAVSIEKCPYVSPETKAALEAASQPPIRLVRIGAGENKSELGNETVMFRHEEKFRNPCAVGFIIEDSETDAAIKEKIKKINAFSFERVGQNLDVNLVAVRQTKDARRFAEAVRLMAQETKLTPVLISRDTAALAAALVPVKDRKPVIWGADAGNAQETARLAKQYDAAVVASASDLEGVSALTQELQKTGVSDILLDTGTKQVSEKLWDLTQIRRLALKKSVRSVGFPSAVIVDNKDSFVQLLGAATYILKYASVVLLEDCDAPGVLALLTLRQNIYSDPQKPLQIEPKVYPIGSVTKQSPVLVTTNFSLSYYTVLGEVESSKVPSYIVSVDTEGMSVLTAWAAEKFTPEKISESLNKFAVSDLVAQKRLIIPGYVAVMSGDLEEQSGWKIVVGPKEAAGIPSFLKNL